MLKKIKEDFTLIPGTAIYLVTREGDILEGFHISSILFDLVSLDRSPIEGSEKQGFTLHNGKLKPNWCEGRRKFIAAFTSREEAECVAKKKQKTL